ncbi:little elongation complex subunit 2 [Mugil cephalus]|uniref:little elongation complex subunit 2 n=1 Tax=Mugil cephalus TaxID=48193 RepID=UPI001FB570B1|nr:little elongation complex subunit 2 [Mugil cephalus]
MELVWEDDPLPEAPFFTRDQYDKYSLAPNIRELWAFLQSPSENGSIKQECDVQPAKASCSSSIQESVESKDKSETEADDAYPEPRFPFPCMSSLSSQEQRIYVGFLKSKKTRHPPQSLQTRVNNEVMQFMRYLQDVAKICAADYSFISQGALQYSEEFFKGCLECIKTVPQLYQIHEMTSLTGGTFNPGLALTFEKQLLTMGKVNITDHEIVPADAQLASDYQSVSSENPPAKKAKDMHATISSDGNAERLAACYEPHVCLTRDALVRLLDNHGPDFEEQWELPVWVKLSPGKARSQRKTVFIDSPLLKTEMTVRERSHIYHEESLKLSVTNNGSVNAFRLMTESLLSEQQTSLESCKRNIMSSENRGLDFDVDLTDLETFGETPSKRSVMQETQKERAGCVESKKDTSLLSSKRKISSQEEVSSSSVNDPITEPAVPAVSDTVIQKTDPTSVDSAQESDENLTFAGDSDDEKLVIDDSLSPAVTPAKLPDPQAAAFSTNTPDTPASESTPESSPHKVTRCKRQSKRAKVSEDQLGEILRMQTAMFKHNNESPKCSKSPSRSTAPVVHSHPTSLVKACVSSYLERNQNEDGETCAASDSSALNVNTTEHKKILSEDLQASAEDEQDYEAPADGNLLYKLYSLQDLLLLVRSSVSLTHTRKVGNSQNQFVPVHVLPKLEYQLSYGVECLTRSEACQLWTETLLHSSTVSYTAHINAHTSKVALLRKLPDDWKQSLSCGFKISKSLNILHHLLKKLTGLEEGQYLIAHKAGEPFVTLLKAANGKVSRGAYDLQQVHGSVPQPPASGPVPWIPVDPAVVLPFHQKHGRVPCTFPPKPFQMTANNGPPHSNSHGVGQKNNSKAQGNKKKGKNRAAKRNKYMKKLIQMSV